MIDSLLDKILSCFFRLTVKVTSVFQQLGKDYFTLLT